MDNKNSSFDQEALGSQAKRDFRKDPFKDKLPIVKNASTKQVTVGG